MHSSHPHTRPSAAIPRLPAEDGPDLRAALEGVLGDRPFSVFLDYDGTLTPLMPRPELAVLDPGHREVLRSLSSLVPTAVISGRDRADVAQLVGLSESITVAGSHGFDIHLAGGQDIDLPFPDAVPALLDRTEAQLNSHLARFDGTLLERKRFSIAAHYRAVLPAEHAAFRQTVADVAAALSADQACADTVGLKLKAGKMVVECMPALDWDKGKAIAHLLSTPQTQPTNAGSPHLDFRERCPVFIGDDVTDEDGFREMGAFGGIGILVLDPLRDDGHRDSLADRRVSDCTQVYRVLEQLIAIARDRAQDTRTD